MKNRKKQIAISLCFCAIMALAVAVTPTISGLEAMKVAGQTDNWGLSFQTEGEAPVANATQEYLQQFDAHYIGDTSQKVIYITFDAGFENGNTQRILEVLKNHQAPAAFFLVGSYIRDHADLVKQMLADGHVVGNHTNTHPDMSAIADMASFQKELEDTENYYKEVTGTEMAKFYRPPQGKYNEENLAMAQELGYTTIFWSLAYVDWYENDQPTKDEAFAKLIPRIHDGAIVLLHSTSQTNAQILDELLTEWENLGYSFKSLTDLPKM